jgi:hypothetical protein
MLAFNEVVHRTVAICATVIVLGSGFVDPTFSLQLVVVGIYLTSAAIYIKVTEPIE